MNNLELNELIELRKFTVNDQILNELIELRKFVEKGETDINRPAWMHIRDGFRDIWNALKGGTS